MMKCKWVIDDKLHAIFDWIDNPNNINKLIK